jgi:hypothetical protein
MSTENDWIKTEWFCPLCGKPHVWKEDTGGGDYYVGEHHICVVCGAGFYLPDKPEKFQELYYSNGQPSIGTTSYLRLMHIVNNPTPPTP